MTENAFDLIDQALRSGGPEAGFDFLAKKAREDKNYPLLFEVRLLRRRHELGLPLIPVDDFAPMPADVRSEYDKAFIEAAREIGGLFLADGNIERAWPYLRAIGETTPVKDAIDKLAFREGLEPVIEIAFMERVHPYKGFEMILNQFGICRAITSFGQFPGQEGRPESLALLVRTLHADLVERLKYAITQVEGQAPETTNIAELMAGRDWLFEEGAYYGDVSHLISVVRFSLDLNDPETLRLAEELTEYGSRLRGVYEERPEPPFDNFYADHRVYLRALQGKDVDVAIAHFHGKLEQSDPDNGTAPAQTLVGLLVRLDRFGEAVEISQAHLSQVPASELGCPSLTQLCYLAHDYDRLRTVAKSRGDLLSYTAQALASR
jgi:hypothetical protein